MDSGPQSEPMVRLTVFFAVLAGMGIWELLAPRRPMTITRTQRWPSNIGLLAVDVVVLRIVFPGAAVGFAVFVETRGWGFLSLPTLPTWLAVAVAVLILDLVNAAAPPVGLHGILAGTVGSPISRHTCLFLSASLFGLSEGLR
jgi:hypothetical protein